MPLVTVIVLTAANYVTLSASTTSSVGEHMVSYSREAVQRSADVVAGSIKALQALSLSPAIIEAVEAANQVYDGRDQAQIDAEIKQLDQAWKDKAASIEPLVTQIGDNDVSAQLKSFLGSFPEEVEVFVTDIQGLNVAMTDRTSDYLQADEGWWEKAYNAGQGATSVGEVEYDESTGVWAVNIGVPVRDRSGQKVIGVLRGTVDISVVFTTLSEIAVGETGRAALLDPQGRILYAHNQNLLMQPAPDALLDAVQVGDSGWRQDLTNLDGAPAVIAYHRLTGPLADSLGWVIVLDQSHTEVSARVWSALSTGLWVAVGLTVVLAVIGLFVARSIAAPLGGLVDEATRLAEGDVERSTGQEHEHVRQRRDEIGDLSRVFDALRSYVGDTAAGARQVAQGNLTAEISLGSERDALGAAFQAMVANLRVQVGQVAEAAASVNAASTQLAGASAQSLAEMAQALQAVVAQFKLPEAAGVEQRPVSSGRYATGGHHGGNGHAMAVARQAVRM